MAWIWARNDAPLRPVPVLDQRKDIVFLAAIGSHCPDVVGGNRSYTGEAIRTQRDIGTGDDTPATTGTWNDSLSHNGSQEEGCEHGDEHTRKECHFQPIHNFPFTCYACTMIHITTLAEQSHRLLPTKYTKEDMRMKDCF